MDWIVLSLLMFLSSVVVYLLIRKATLSNLPTELVNLASFFVPLIIYSVIAWKGKVEMAMAPYPLLVIFLLSIVGSYLSNITSLKSIKFAPNPGYSLILSKSYVVFTTLAAVLLFGSHLTLRSVLAILMIVGFSVLITVGKTLKHKHSNSLWLPFALFSFFGWGILSIGTKYAFTLGVNIYQRLIYLTAFVTIYILIEIFIRKSKIINLSMKDYVLLILIGIFSAAFNYFMIAALDVAPNIGYVNAINASSISALTVFSALIFRDEFTFKKFVGVLGVTAGLIILVV